MRLLAFCMALLIGARAHATEVWDTGWFEAGDMGLRTDLLLLNDAGVVRVPVNSWPIARATLAAGFAHAKEHLATNAAVLAALSRVRARLEPAAAGGHSLRFSSTLTAGKAGLTRDFDTLAREDAELSGALQYDAGSRISASVRVTAVADPTDDRQVRLDGSHATVQLGNWLLSANTLDRWWGPSHESSLILSSNARPMPTFMVERAAAQPFESRWLSWLGPWRFTFGISQMENEREDIDSPLFMSWRVAIMPLRDVEIGFSRTAQFCGEQLVCDADSFFNMLAGNDNVGFDATPETERIARFS